MPAANRNQPATLQPNVVKGAGEESPQYYLVFQHTSDACFITSKDGAIHEVNEAAALLFCASQNCIQGQSIHKYLEIDKSLLRQLVKAEWEAPIEINVKVHAGVGGSRIPVCIVPMGGKQADHLCWLLRLPQDGAPIGDAYGSALATLASTLNSSLNLDEVLDRMLESVGQVVPHDAANVMLVEGNSVRVVGCRGYIQRNLHDFMLSLQYPVHQSQGHDWEESIDLLPFSYWRDLPELNWVRSNIGAPIRIEGKTIGFLNLDSAAPHSFTSRTAERLQAFADQAAVAIHNARLYQQAQQAAVVEERQRLARDLHDAVSQTLWSASLIADVLPDLWRRDAAKGERKLALLNQLIHGALFEMRALLLELVPSALVEVGLEESLIRLIQAGTHRADATIELEVVGQARSLPSEVQITFYRVTQEAINNLIKHSGATSAKIILRYADSEVQVEIRDNGRGFSQHTIQQDNHFGLSFMRDRMKRINGTVTIISKPGEGTIVQAQWPGKKIGAQHDR